MNTLLNWFIRLGLIVLVLVALGYSFYAFIYHQAYVKTARYYQSIGFKGDVIVNHVVLAKGRLKVDYTYKERVGNQMVSASTSGNMALGEALFPNTVNKQEDEGVYFDYTTEAKWAGHEEYALNNNLEANDVLDLSFKLNPKVKKLEKQLQQEFVHNSILKNVTLEVKSDLEDQYVFTSIPKLEELQADVVSNLRVGKDSLGGIYDLDAAEALEKGYIIIAIKGIKG